MDTLNTSNSENLNRRDFIKATAACTALGIAKLWLPGITFAGQGQAMNDDSALIELDNFACLIKESDAFVETPVLASNGVNTWLAWLNRKPNGHDAVMLNIFDLDKWSPPKSLTLKDGAYDSIRLACVSRGRPMAVWVHNIDDAWFIESAIYDGNSFANPLRITFEDDKVSNPYLIACAKDEFWLAWESYKDGRFTIKLKGYSHGKWEKSIAITKDDKNSYEPSLTVDPSGLVWLAYSVAENGEKNVYLRNFDPKTFGLSEEIPVCIDGSGSYSCGNPNVFSDSEGKIWITWENINNNTSPRKPACYFGMNECFVACYTGSKLLEVEPQKDGYLGKKVFTSSGDNNRFPVLRKGKNKLWLFARQSQEKRRAWRVLVSCLDEPNGWTGPKVLLENLPTGRMEPLAVISTGDDSFWIAWQGDNWYEIGVWETTRIDNIKSNLYVARIKIQPKDNAKQDKPLKFVAATVGNHSSTRLGRTRGKRRTIEVNGDIYTLLYGNLHEHTIISRCWPDCSDGSIDENYRYGMDAEGYDFIGLTDHCFDITEVNWRKIRRAARFYTESPYFVGLPAYEWTLSAKTRPPGSGHRNIIFASDEEAAKFVWQGKNVYHKCMPESDMPDKIWKLLRERNITAVTIPHHTILKDHPMDWNYHDPHYQCVVEIFQGYGSCEYKGCPLEKTQHATQLQGSYVGDALARGYKMGFIGSGDHNQMGVGLAAVFVKEVSTKGIVEALLARRCFATTGDKIFVDFRINGYVMGADIRGIYKPPHITAKIEATAPLKNIVILKNGNPIYEKKDDELNSQTNWGINIEDERFQSSSYYYLRAIQNNGAIVWSSPIWI